MSLRSLTTLDELRDHFAASLRLSLVQVHSREARLVGELEMEAMGQIVNDLMVPTHPPLAAVVDVLRSIVHFDDVRLATGGPFPRLARDYRHRVLHTLLRDDPSIPALARVAERRTGRAWTTFIGFLARELGRAFTEICCFPWRYDCPDLPTMAECRRFAPSPGALRAESKSLEALVHAYPHFDRLFNEEQVMILSHLRDEADIAPLQQYFSIWSALTPVGLDVAKRARSARFRHVEVEDHRAPSMGGYSGLRSGGSLDQLGALLPSELAQMDDASSSSEGKPQVDGFDINLIEKRLLFFKRDQQIDVRRRRRFYFAFVSPSDFDFQPSVVPARWQYLFLSVLFDIIRFFRDELQVHHYPFFFIFTGQERKIDDYVRVIEAIREQNFSDVRIEINEVADEKLTEHLQEETALDDAEHTVVLLSPPNQRDLVELPEGVDDIRVDFETRGGADLVRVESPVEGNRRRFELSISNEDDFKDNLCSLRDIMMVLVAGGGKLR